MLFIVDWEMRFAVCGESTHVLSALDENVGACRLKGIILMEIIQETNTRAACSTSLARSFHKRHS